MKEFRSFLAPQIRHFIRYRQASQRWNGSSYEENLMLFDRYCLENYPGDTMLTQEMVDGWCRQRDTEAKLNESAGQGSMWWTALSVS